jgi:cytoskeletal protein CcmA (bactofilin family)
MSESVFADDLHIKGSVISKGDIKLNGVVEGDVSARTLLINKNAEIIGSATAEKVVVVGSVEGSVIGVRVELTSSAKVQGDLICKTLLIDENAYFNGTAKHVEDPLKDGR